MDRLAHSLARFNVLTFSTGAVFPLLPYLFGFSLLWLALVSGGIGLFVAGALFFVSREREFAVRL